VNSNLLFPIRYVEIEKFDLKHQPYIIRYPFAIHGQEAAAVWLEELISSIRRFGLLSPPIVYVGKEERGFIIHGVRRFLACQALGWTSLPCRVISSDIAPSELYQLSLSIFLSHHKPNVMEQARIIQRLQTLLPQEVIIQEFLPRLGLSPQRKVLERISQLAGLEDEIAEHLALGETDPQLGWRLIKLTPSSARLAMHRFLRKLPFTLSQQFEIVEYVQEIAHREQRSVEDLLGAQAVLELLASDLDQRQKANAVRLFWRSRRYPRLTALEEEFNQQKKALRLPEHLELYPPHNFEHGSYKFELKFADLAELRQKLEFLNNLISCEKFKNIIKS